jgi:hypothetical protein
MIGDWVGFGCNPHTMQGENLPCAYGPITLHICKNKIEDDEVWNRYLFKYIVHNICRLPEAVR